MNKETKNLEKGITLIALVITIIVLLILAGVSIAMLTGDNGILTKSTDAKTETSHGEIKENVILGVNEWFAEKNDPNANEVDENVIRWLNTKGYIVSIEGKEYYKVPDKGSLGKGATKEAGDIYVIEKDTTTTAKTTKLASTIVLDGEKIADTTTEEWYWLKYYETSSKSRNLLKISTLGKIEYVKDTTEEETTPTNPDAEPEEPLPDDTEKLSDWEYTLSELESIITLTKYIGTNPEVTVYSSYNTGGKKYSTVMKKSTSSEGPFVKNTSITKVAFETGVKYEENSMEEAFYSCTSLIEVSNLPTTIISMYDTFGGCSSLKVGPSIPENVTNMYGTFGGCTSLTSAPSIPSKVTYMNQTFAGCTSLVEGPNMTNATSVDNMHATFGGCISLKTPPVIPESVTDMSSTFGSCISLEVAPIIPEGVTNIEGLFYGNSLITEINILSSNAVLDGSFIDFGTYNSKQITLIINTPGPNTLTYSNFETVINGNPYIVLN